MLFVALLATPGARADIYKCTSEDGGITYSQTPCPAQKTVDVGTGGSAAPAVAPDCSHANQFAFSSARLMRAGLTSSELFDRYGGVDALTKGAIGTINYVYGFRTSDNVTVERIAALTEAKCKARALGDVSCAALPPGYTESIGGCDAENAQGDDRASPAADAQTGGRKGAGSGAGSSAAGSRAAVARNREITERCKQPYRDSIDAIEVQMRRGFTSEQGEVYRRRLRGLTQQMRRC